MLVLGLKGEAVYSAMLFSNNFNKVRVVVLCMFIKAMAFICIDSGHHASTGMEMLLDSFV